ncbi:MAG: oligosaccharide flippase family protein [Planctomycetota bacterium]
MTTVLEPPPAPPRKTLANKVAWSSVSTSVASIGGSIAGIFAARLLGAAGMGQLAFLVWTMETVGLVLQFGLGRTLTRFLAETGSNGLAVWLGRRLVALTSISAVAFYVITPWLAKGPIEPHVLLLATAMLFLSGPDTVARAYLAGTQNFRSMARLNIFAGCAEILGVSLGGWFFGLPGVIAGYALRPLIGLPIAYTMLRRRPEPPSFALRRRLRRFGGWVWVSSLIAIVSWSRIELVFLERMATAVQVGYFAVALRVIQLATRFPLMLGSAFVPHFAELYGADDHDKVASGYATGTRLLAMLLFPCCLGLAATAPVVVPMLYGGDFRSAVPIVVVLAIGSCMTFANIGASLIAGVDRLHIRVRWSIPAALAMVVLLPGVVAEHGAWGATWVRLAVRSIIIVISTTYVVRCLRMPLPARSLLRTLAAAVVCAIGASAIVRVWPAPAALLVAIPAGVLIYLAALRLFQVVHADDRAAFERFLVRSPRWLRSPALAVLRFVGGGA